MMAKLIEDNFARGNLTKKCSARLDYPNDKPVCGEEVLPVIKDDLESGQVFTEFYENFCHKP